MNVQFTENSAIAVTGGYRLEHLIIIDVQHIHFQLDTVSNDLANEL